MKCRKCFRDLTAYLEGTLGPEAQAGVERHLDECKECRGFAEFLRDNYFLAAEEYRVEPAPFFFTRVKARLESVTATTANSSWRVLLQPAFFSLLLLLGIYSGIRLGSTLNPGSRDRLTAERFVPWINELETEPIENFLMN
ncbi:MAG TPA: zf-HC2 domain-containing protein [Prolixibacteraceae bacterium]|nr:MAG: hypothetical protein BWX87_00006 [Bacteroidetes bacterium ADurb.Bin123]HPV18715.1 zf-HC2 domain-containing protein [Prolixibacteraceae bacterium]